LGEVDAGAAVQMGAQIKGRVISLRLPMRRGWWGDGGDLRIDQSIKGVENVLDVLIAERDVLLGKIIEFKGLGEGENMFGAVISLQRLGNGVLAGFNAIVPIQGEGPRVAFSSHNGADNAQARHAGNITHHVVQVEMHLVERFLHMLHMLRRHLAQTVTMAHQTPELTDGLRGPKRRCSQPLTM
jgi:hypothetical protein